MPRIRLPLLPAWLRWAGVLVIASVIFYFSVITVPPGVPEPGPLFDKKLHFAAYGAFTLALAYATASSTLDTRIRILVVIGCALAYGIGIELLQGLVPYRYYSPADLLANTLGVALASSWFLVEPRLGYAPLRSIRS